jgi:hypothetical protein
LSGLNRSDIAFLLVGTAVAGLVAWLSIGWLLRYVAHTIHSSRFGIYRIVASVHLLLRLAPPSQNRPGDGALQHRLDESRKPCSISSQSVGLASA